MTDRSLLLAIDQGTTSSRAIIYDAEGKTITVAQEEFAQHYPADGWVEHAPEDIWSTVVNVVRAAITQLEEIAPDATIAAIGITNQRETTLVWNRKTGEPVHRAIVWQDRRTAPICATLKQDGLEESVRSKTGLRLDPYFSATKVKWILDNVEGAREAANNGDLAFGTVDSFLIWKLTGGKVHATDVTNASRTCLFDINTQRWDEELLAIFDIPSSLLPTVKDCAADFGVTTKDAIGTEIPICGVAGDQQAAAIGQACFEPGSIKSTYGTGCFVIVNTGPKPILSKNNLLTTIAYRIKGETHYAIEGSIFIAGAAIQWLRDELGIIKDAAETEALAASLSDNGGIYLVPAFTGLGAPYWDPDARGAIFGLTRGANKAHLARAGLESVVYQTTDLLSAISADGIAPTSLKVDGGMVANDWAMQFLSDLSNINVERPVVTETTAFGAASLAGLQIGLQSSLSDIQKSWQLERAFSPSMDQAHRTSLLQNWKNAVSRTRSSQSVEG